MHFLEENELKKKYQQAKYDVATTSTFPHLWFFHQSPEGKKVQKWEMLDEKGWLVQGPVTFCWPYLRAL